MIKGRHLKEFIFIIYSYLMKIGVQFLIHGGYHYNEIDLFIWKVMTSLEFNMAPSYIPWKMILIYTPNKVPNKKTIN